MTKTRTNACNSFGAKAALDVGGAQHVYYRLNALTETGAADVSRLPFSIRILLEALLRTEDGFAVTQNDILALAKYDPKAPADVEIPFKPARVILQDFTGVPAVVDLAALRSAMVRLGGDPKRINPLIPVDLVIDHSVQVDRFNSPFALVENASIEFERNRERYTFLRWGQKAFKNFRVVPPASGIVHQVNLEYLATVVATDGDAEKTVYPDTLVGTDSHTTMINGLGVLGWGVGGIEAEAVMLGQPIYMKAPEVVGFKLTGQLPEGATATDLVLVVTQILRKKGVVEKFVEFYGPGLASMSLPDRATIANMAPEYGATIGFFPVDDETLSYMRRTGRDEKQVALVEAYCKAQGLFRTASTPDPIFTDALELDLSTVKPSLAGPKRPQDRLELGQVKAEWKKGLAAPTKERGFALDATAQKRSGVVKQEDGRTDAIGHGTVVIAAITSCTNTSNPSVMLGAGLLAKKAVEKGLTVKPYVKTSLAPGSKVVTGYLDKAGLTPYLEKLGFYTVGYGCTTCIGNSGPLPENVVAAIQEGDLVAASVLSGNRNFEGRINPHVKANFLASPPLVVAYAIAGTVDIDLLTEPIGKNAEGQAVYLKDIWPTPKEIRQAMDAAIAPEMFKRSYSGIESSNEEWNKIPIGGGELFEWDEASTYIQEPPFFVEMSRQVSPIAPIADARVLVKVGDSVTTDHISPAGSIPENSPAGRYLKEHGVVFDDFNTFGSRRGNDRVMVRGTFGNIRLKNDLAGGKEGNWTTHLPSDELTSIYDASLTYKASSTPTIVLAGKDYGMGSSRDWAAKGVNLLGVRAVIAESFERIHRSNLVGMGVLPLQFKPGQNAESLGLTGRETFTIHVDDSLAPRQEVLIDVRREDGKKDRLAVLCRIDTPVEIEYYRNGGILHTVLRNILKETT
ncbi:MAG: aconitate hydratase AcnA [Myxococcales bacterium]|nr:MAG: aconitate hydratase AcnA [Myxococcales bacterium]